ncbi:MAG: YedE-related selenium metabolism membrane protein [Nitrospirae bacterium]|nr:YedE-related selenium metabolism membrane protein [Nitrospirota bacterium]
MKQSGKINFLITGSVLGIGAVLLSYFGNPPNTGICVSCFMRNIAGAVGLHNDIRMQYIRPEIVAFVFGSFLTSIFTKEFKTTSGSSPLLRFFVGILLIIGCSVFIGCPIKLILRISAGDFPAITGVIGLAAGLWTGLQFLEGGFRLGRPSDAQRANGFIIPVLMLALFILLIVQAPFINFSTKGSAALHAPVWMSLLFGLLIGSFAQISGFCITGGLARLFLWGPKEVHGCPKSTGLLLAIGSFFLIATIANLLTGQFSFDMTVQTGSSENFLWDALGMGLVGFGSVLIKGCPFRQLILSGQGDTDAGATVMGMLVGGALVQNWGLAATSAAVPFQGKIAVLAGFVFLFAISLLYRERDKGLAPEYQTGLD